MKSVRFFLLVLSLFNTNVTFAKDSALIKFCENEVMKENLYATFVQSKTLKYKYVALYKTVGSQLSSYLKEACISETSLTDVVKDAHSACVKSCDQNADAYIENKFSGKKEMRREIFNECASICDSTYNSFYGYMAGLKDGKSKTPNDCENPTRDNINDLGRKIKDIQSEPDKNSQESNKTISK